MNKSFKFGKLVLTSGINNLIADDLAFSDFVMKSLKRHMLQDWGDLCAADKETNNKALERFEGKLNGQLFSTYKDKKHPEIWIITEWDESVTTILFPSDY